MWQKINPLKPLPSPREISLEMANDRNERAKGKSRGAVQESKRVENEELSNLVQREKLTLLFPHIKVSTDVYE